ncbi:hypothetical protein Vadar_007080 [Vaccinium darrowii]|uniref:Uncharacterized protein n=1 Tax=Vaccinium darrowii TaxID=229202 RepID=A0ACB7WYY7_9ERIC|nr:hypothetical protein Vadar_007080 [Vaccinium darrowii]
MVVLGRRWSGCRSVPGGLVAVLAEHVQTDDLKTGGRRRKTEGGSVDDRSHLERSGVSVEHEVLFVSKRRSLRMAKNPEDPRVPFYFRMAKNPEDPRVPFYFKMAKNPEDSRVPFYFRMAKNPEDSRVPFYFRMAKNPEDPRVPFYFRMAKNPEDPRVPFYFRMAKNPEDLRVPFYFRMAKNPEDLHVPFYGRIVARPKVDKEKVHGPDDIQRLYIVMRPESGQRPVEEKQDPHSARKMKKLPKRTAMDPNMKVDMVFRSRSN